jgi:hypothetical protein
MVQTAADVWNTDVMGAILWLNEAAVTIQLISGVEPESLFGVSNYLQSTFRRLS